jgi:site-specific DNA-methyltransferase (adenine-specific)
MKTRYERIGDATLFLADCRAILPRIGNIDAIVTDPPYGINYVKGKTGRRGRYRNIENYVSARNDQKITGDAEPFDPTHLLKFDNVLMWGANHYCHQIPEGKGRWLIWNKLGRIVESFDSFSDVEIAWHSHGTASRVFHYLWKGITCVKVGEDNGRRHHPTMKPVGLMSWCLEQIGDAEIICDPYLGSGSTGVACVRAGRRFVGIEVMEKYFDVSCHRIEKAYNEKGEL